MSTTSKVYAARLAGLVVLGPDGESVGRVRDVVLTLRSRGQQPRVVGLVVELLTRRRIFVPILRVTSIEPAAVTLISGSVSIRKFAPRPGEILVLGDVLDTMITVNAPDISELHGQRAAIVDVEIEQTRTRDWIVSRLAVRRYRGRLARRGGMHVIEWGQVTDLPSLTNNDQDTEAVELLAHFDGMRPADVAHELTELSENRRNSVAMSLDVERLADIVQELPDEDRVDVLEHIGTERAAEVLEAMERDDAADLLRDLEATDAEQLLALMDPEDSRSVRRLLNFAPSTAGGFMDPEPIILDPQTTVAEALAHARNPDHTAALASVVFVVRPPTATPTGRYLGCVHFQALLREPPSTLVSGVLDSDLPTLRPEDSLSSVARYFATYNLVCGPVVDEQNHLIGAVTVDDLLDELLPADWRDRDLRDDHEVLESGKLAITDALPVLSVDLGDGFAQNAQNADVPAGELREGEQR